MTFPIAVCRMELADNNAQEPSKLGLTTAFRKINAMHLNVISG